MSTRIHWHDKKNCNSLEEFPGSKRRSSQSRLKNLKLRAKYVWYPVLGSIGLCIYQSTRCLFCWMCCQNPQATTEQSLMISSSPSSFWFEVIHGNYCTVYLYKFSKPLFRAPINLHQGSLAQNTSSMAGKVQHNGVNPVQRDSWELVHRERGERERELVLHITKCNSFYMHAYTVQIKRHLITLVIIVSAVMFWTLCLTLSLI